MWQQETLMLLQTLSTRDPDELAEGLRPWELRCKQLGGGSFRGELKRLQLGRIQIVRTSGNRRLQAQGSAPSGSFGFAPVLPSSEGAIWRGRRCKTGQVVTIDPGQEADHITAADYEFVCLTVDGDFFRGCAAVPGGFDPEEWLAGRLAITPSPAGCRALTAHLRELLDLAEARPDLFVQPQTRQVVERPDGSPQGIARSGRSPARSVRPAPDQAGGRAGVCPACSGDDCSEQRR
jgi:hypothetical protein